MAGASGRPAARGCACRWNYTSYTGRGKNQPTIGVRKNDPEPHQLDPGEPGRFPGKEHADVLCVGITLEQVRLWKGMNSLNLASERNDRVDIAMMCNPDRDHLPQSCSRSPGPVGQACDGSAIPFVVAERTEQTAAYRRQDCIATILSAIET